MALRNGSLPIAGAIFIGAAIKVAAFIWLEPEAVLQWYAPFLEVSLTAPNLDPWTVWLSSGGDPLAFPYGTAMWILFLPACLLAAFIGASTSIAYLGTLLAADLALLFVLARILQIDVGGKLLILYWFSPIIIGATYVLGLNDVLPVLLLFFALLLTRTYKPILAGVVLAFAISAKLSMIIAVPFFLIYLWNNRAMRFCFPKFTLSFFITILALAPLALVSRAHQEMLLGNPEVTRILSLSVGLGSGGLILLVPLAYLVLLYFSWRVRRPNVNLIISIMGLSFLVVVLLTATSPGWFVWLVPFFVIYQFRSDAISIVLVGLLSVIYAFMFVILPEFTVDLDQTIGVVREDSLTIQALGTTSLITVGAILGVRMFRESVSQNDYFRLSQRPFSIGIAGDSGTGKDTLASTIIDLFGDHSVTHLSGDGYHRWDRAQPMWSVTTHLNPSANDLERFVSDATRLCTGRRTLVSAYDHSLGRSGHGEILGGGDVVLISGLHALYPLQLRELLDLAIFLEMDEDLRRVLKLQRDVSHRGHSRNQALEIFDRRAKDASKFIQPQRANADLTFSLLPIGKGMITTTGGPLRLKVLAQSRYGFSDQELIRALVGTCGLHVDLTSGSIPAEDVISVEGESDGEDFRLVARQLCPRVVEFLDVTPLWHNGVTGVMQLITLWHIDRTLRSFLPR